MRLIKVLCSFLLCIGLLTGCQKNTLKLRNSQFTMELGNPVIEDVSCYLDLEDYDDAQIKDIKANAYLEIAGHPVIYDHIGEYQAEIHYQSESIMVPIIVQDTSAPTIHGPLVLTTPLHQKMNYQSLYKFKDEAGIKQVQFDDQYIQLDQKGEYPLLITAIDNNNNTARQKVTVKVGENKEFQVPNNVQLQIPYYNQLDVNAPNGCEATALYMALKYQDKVHIDLKTFIQKQPKGETPYLGFAGDPFASATHNYDYYTIFPSALMKYGLEYSSCYDISHHTMTEIKQELSQNRPVIVWLTGGLQDPVMVDHYFGHVVRNLHIVLLSGYDDQKQIFHVLDPIDRSKTSITYKQFEKIYNKMKYAMSVSE